VRPGLTDPATLKYHNECDLLAAASDPLAYFRDVVTPDKLRLSEEYLERATVWSDFDVLVQTVATVMAHSFGSALSTSGRSMRTALRSVALSFDDSIEQDAAVLR
jgi:lipopolysaccharide/colanic/teichoic acid biosynthesis glycosyltransferase